MRPEDIVAASAFLEAYRTASEAQSGEFYDLYSDRAVIRARTEERTPGVAFQGRTFKAWGRQLLRDGRTGLDASIFHHVSVEQHGNRLLIRAQRYSTTRCYWDPQYQVGIEREGTSYRIVDEHLTTHPGATCGIAAPAMAALQGVPMPAPGLDRPFPASPPRNSVPPMIIPANPSSDEELARQAIELAQQFSGANTDAARSVERSPGSELLAHPDASFAVPPSAVSASRVDAANDLRVTPAD